KISQTVDELQQLEKQQTNVANRDYVRFIRLLKEKQANSQKQAAQLINLGLRQGQRIWAKYLSEGLEALIEVRSQPYVGKLSFTQISHLRQFLYDDQAHSLADVQAYLAGSHGVNYTIGGVSAVCKRLKIKKKTGRPVHICQMPDAVETYKKNLPT
ncbi:helix-turn-helix domain-containing protein, partial [Spirosoma utsteinense]